MIKKILILFVLAACSFSSENRFRSKGEGIVKEIADLLGQVQTHEELQQAVPRLKKKFNQLADILLELKAFRKKKSDDPFSGEPLGMSEALFAELARLYEIPGYREIIESAQEEAVYKLSRRNGVRG